MPNFRIIRNKKMNNGFYSRESYSISEYLILIVIDFIVILPFKLILSTLFYIIKLIFWLLRFVLDKIEITKSFSKKIGNQSFKINNLKEFMI